MWQGPEFEPGELNDVYPGSDGAVHGGGRILCAVPGCLVQGMQVSPNWLLAASAARFPESHDCGVAEARKARHARGVRVR
jgi:hypothetical protein